MNRKSIGPVTARRSEFFGGEVFTFKLPGLRIQQRIPS
jgi:hypothetical protein